MVKARRPPAATLHREEVERQPRINERFASKFGTSYLRGSLQLKKRHTSEKLFESETRHRVLASSMYKATERCVSRPDMKPGPCPRCGGTLEWKATVGTPQTVEAHFTSVRAVIMWSNANLQAVSRGQ